MQTELKSMLEWNRRRLAMVERQLHRTQLHLQKRTRQSRKKLEGRRYAVDCLARGLFNYLAEVTRLEQQIAETCKYIARTDDIQDSLGQTNQAPSDGYYIQMG